jgi:hypothetical protein
VESLVRAGLREESLESDRQRRNGGCWRGPACVRSGRRQSLGRRRNRGCRRGVGSLVWAGLSEEWPEAELGAKEKRRLPAAAAVMDPGR